MKNKQLVLLGVSGLVIVLSWTFVIISSFKQPPSSPLRAASINELVKTGGQEVVVKLRMHSKRTGYAHWGKNPFSFSPSTEGAEYRKLKLSGISWDAKKPKALINGKILNVGDEIDGIRIMKIEQDKVTLNDGNESFELRVGFEH
jgi:hypothetical protein